MSDPFAQPLPPGFTRGPSQGGDLLGEITEAVHRWLLDGWPAEAGRAPRIEEDLSFVPKDREEVVYVYMYRVAKNDALKNGRRWRPAHLVVERDEGTDGLYERPPLFLQAYYLVAVHSRFRSEAERLLGWTMMRLNDASHLIHRPRKYVLPTGVAVDSLGRPWDASASGEVEMEKVALSMVDDLPVGDAVHFFTIHEAPYRPYLTYRAMCAMRGPLLQGPPTDVAVPRTAPWDASQPDQVGKPRTRPSGRMPQGARPSSPPPARPPIGPDGVDHRPISDSTNPGSKD